MSIKTAYKVVVFDVDGTLVKEQSSWVTIHEFFRTEKLARENLKLYEGGDIDYLTFMRWDISLWQKPLHIDKINNILSKYSLKSDATYVIKKLRDRGCAILLLSAGVDILTQKVAKTLGVKFYLANGLEIDNDGYLTGNGIFRVDLLDKHLALKNMLDGIECRPESCVAVGDSKYDTSLLKYVGCGVALGDDRRLKNSAHYTVHNLSELLNII